MSAKEFLNSQLHVDIYKQALIEYRDKMKTCLEKRKRTKKLDEVTAQADQLCMYYDQVVLSVDRDILKLAEEEKKVINLIDRLDDERFKLIIVLRYIHKCTWEEIAEALHCTPSYAHRLHKKAIKELDRHISEIEEN